ncbi:Uncharacterized protein Adt_05145 [Abeliophyllum distichum]|uniref:Reverse transcriptase domain-containing protein n=1 Tax=Abeliophyllum distichum TaxID=126358 RepID=A0ABD1V386_9LAMI
MPYEPTKPPDFPITGHMPHISGPTPPENLQFTATLGFNPSDAAASHNGNLPFSQSPMDAPPPDVLIEGSIASQNLSPAVLNSGLARVPLPAPSGTLAASSNPPISELPTSATLPSIQLIAPGLQQTLPSADVPHAPLPAPQAPPAASAQQPNLGVVNSIGPILDPSLRPRVAPDPIAEDPSEANVPAPALPACTAGMPVARLGMPVARQQANLRPPQAASSGPLRLPKFSAPIAPGPHVFPQEAQSALNNGKKTYAAAVTEKQTISPSERSMRKSFASVLQSDPDSACHQFVAKEPFLHRGEPALTITADEEASLAEPFKFTLVGKFSHCKPSMVEVRNSFQKFGLTGDFKIGLIDFKHVLIHLTHEDDYSRLFLKPLWFIMGCPMRVLKWTCDFHPDAETPIAPVWISFPLLPVHLRAKEFLYALSKLVGIPLRIDEATADLLRPSEARVCVEVNLEHKLPERVWIERGESRSFWQPVVYEQLPHFCAKCRHMGHLIDKCRVGMPPIDVDRSVQATKPVGAPATKPIADVIPKPTVGAPAPKLVVVELPVDVEMPLVDKAGKGKGKEVVVETRKQWVPLASSSLIPPPISTPPPEEFERPTSEHVPPVASFLASKPVTTDTTYDPLLDHMMSVPREYPMLSEPVQPVFDPVPHNHPDPNCLENVEVADTASSIQLGGHQQGHFRRNSSEDLDGLGERQESDGFTTVQRKKSSKGVDIPRPSSRVTRSQAVILEPFVLKKNFDFIRRSLAFDVGLENESGKIWSFWNLGTTVASCVDHPQFLHIRVEDPRLPRPMYITPVYASCSPTGRRDLWMGLHQISLVVDGPWMVGGDFNVIVHNGERIGHNTRDRGTSDFADMMMDCGLTDAGYSGSQYTWTNGRVWKWLDRVLINSAIGSSCSRFSVRHLNRSTSDHSPLLIQWSSDDDLGPRPFRFLNVWSRHHDFLSFVSQKWSFPTHHTGMTALWEKIFRLKQGLRWWNRHVFGDIFQRVRDAECRVDEAESVYDSDPTPAHRDTLHQAQAGLNQTLSVEEAFWKQKAGARWVCEGDHNTRYFHSMVQGRRIRSRIWSITSETGEVFDSQETIQPSAVSFFQELLSADPQPVDPIRPDIIPRLVSDEDNLQLNRIPTLAEVREAIFSIDPDSVAGPDGFSSHFFQECWDIISDDVFQAVLDFFAGGHFPRGFSATSIVLIPKRDNACRWSEFRPISLCTVFNKLVTKLLNSRLSNILPQIISAPQSGFIPGRLIGDNILLAQELLHTLDTKIGYRGAPQSVTFQSCSMVDHVVFSPHPGGLRQGDPISPSLFILAADYFSRILTRQYQQIASMAYRHGGDALISHLCFADDMIIFANGQKQSIRRVLHCIEHYERASGQLVNRDKSGIILPKRATIQQIHRLEHLTGFRHQQQSVTYLGVPLFKGHRKIFLYDDLIQKVRSRISGWASRLLSPGGRITLIRSVLSSLPLYLLQILKPPKAVLKKLESIFARFLWDSKDHTHRLHWKRWKDLCLPTEEGGLGFRRLQDLVDTFSLKLWWLFRSQRSLWAQFLRGKYCQGTHPILTTVPYYASPVWKRLKLIGPQAEPYIAWKLGRGLIQIVPLTMVEQIRSIPITPHVDDQIVWTDTSDGRFVTKSAWQLVRTGSNIQAVYRMIWSSIIPTTVSFFCWRLWQGLIPVDVVIQRRIGSHMASRHLSYHPQTARGIPVSLPGLEILGSVCQHGTYPHDHTSIDIMAAYFGTSIGVETWTSRRFLVSSLPPPSHPPPTLVFWRTPPVGSYKINTDGCVKDGFASGGGIIRDSSGQCIRAFFSFYGDCTILEAELRAIRDGIILAQRLGLSVLWVESDSTLAIHCITKGGGPWHIQATIRHIRHLQALDRDTITHIYREGNQVADLLASEGWDRRCYHEYSSQDLPRRHRSLVQIDRFGLPTVRGL